MPCEACTSLEPVDRHRGHYICKGCLMNWRHRDELAGFPLSWEQFLDPGTVYAFPQGGMMTLKSNLANIPAIQFSAGILKEAAALLKQQRVTQTIRSKNATIIKGFRHRKLNIGSEVQILLDNSLIGFGEVKVIEPSPWVKLTTDDARRSGFANRRYLKAALTRAGFRFKPLEDYVLYRVMYRWL